MIRRCLLLVPACTVALACCGGPGTDAALKARSIRAQERLGIRAALATCVANAASVELSRDEMRTFAANPTTLPPGLAQRVTKLAADCAIEVAPTPSTLPATVATATTVTTATTR